MKKIAYWGPFIDNVATVKAILNSSISINKYSKKYKSIILNASGEWDLYKNIKNSTYYDLRSENYINKLPKFSFVKSRYSYILIILKSFFPLKNYIEKEKPDFLIIHLITSLPIILFLLFNFNTKLCLRISGLPKLNIFRKFLWKLCNKKLHKVYCPTLATLNKLKSLSIFDDHKLNYLPDPIISSSEIIKLKNEKNLDTKFSEDNLILVGRLTKQKNFELFVDAFVTISKKYPKIKANIFGEGELKNDLINKIKEQGLEERIKLLGYKKNIFKYFYKSKFFVLTSLWEDPGFVIAEAAFLNLCIISSNCPNGPEEILEYGKGGYIFKNNNKESLISCLEDALSEKEKKIYEKKLMCKKSIRRFTLFNHFKLLEKILD